MNRRGFLKFLSSLPLVGLLPGVGKAEDVASAPAAPEVVETLEVWDRAGGGRIVFWRDPDGAYARIRGFSSPSKPDS